MVISKDLEEAISYLKKGQIIAYPTEAVFGIGCDPFNVEAVTKILQLKKRVSAKGLIVITSSWEQIVPLIQPLDQVAIDRVMATWPGPCTWVFPASEQAPHWIVGDYKTIAIRMTAHPVAKRLCQLFDKPIVSTSANLASQPPARTIQEVINYFHDDIPFILEGDLGSLKQPTPIRDVLTGEFLRQ